MHKDFISEAKTVNALAAQSITAGATINGTAIDTKGFRWIAFTLNTGVNAATAEGSFKIQGSDTSGGTYADIAGTTVSIAAADDNTIFRGALHLDQMPRYLRLVATAGTGGALLASATAVLTGCADTTQYLDHSSGGADEISFTVLTVA